MTIALQAVVVKHEQRIRLVFTSALASGAFGVSPTLYTVRNQDGLGTDPSVTAAMIVTGNPNVVDLALGTPLASGAQYKVYAEVVPGLDSTTTPSGTFEPFRYSTGLDIYENKEPGLKDRDRVVYGIDLLWNGVDFQEGPNGDLERVTGTPNVSKALYRGVRSDGLSYAPEWGAHAREYVDSPSGAAGTLTGSVQSQLLRDPRVKAVKVTFEVVADKTFIHAQPVLKTGEPIGRVSLTVPNAS